MKKMSLLLLLLVLLAAALQAQNYKILIDHSNNSLDVIPTEYIDLAKQNVRFAYAHASHGSQPISGMRGIEDFIGAPFEFSINGAAGELYIDDYITGFMDLGDGITDSQGGSWVEKTRNYLNNPDNANINALSWAWSYPFSDDGLANDSTVQGYLDSMSVLEQDYPHITFVYQTSPISKGGRPETAEIYVLNQKIRDYCSANYKVLYDFADIESHDPDGNYYLDKLATEDCFYDSNNNGIINKIDGSDANWADEWCAANPGECFYTGSCSHSRALNCQMKGIAFWHLFAKLAGWEVAIEPCVADVNGDQVTNVLDFNSVVGFYGLTCGSCAEDINNDGNIDVLDFNIIVGNYGLDCIQ
jgi:hypothetical protein